VRPRAQDARAVVLALGAVLAMQLRAGAAPAVPVVPRAPAEVGRLTWLAGCWEQRAGTRLVEEQWMAPRAGTMLGMSRTVRGDTLVEFEQTRIVQRGERAVYVAAPSGQARAEFEARELTDTSAVFENLAHDFPQRIVYRRRGADSLVARVEATRGGRVRGVDFPYQRVSCR
jgi:Domain of unknown function (DUF6265)